MNSLEDRLQYLANHLDNELRSTPVEAGSNALPEMVGASTTRRSSTAPRDPMRLRPVTITAVVLAVAACIAVGVTLSHRVDHSATSLASPPAAAPDPSVWDGGVELVVYVAHGAPADDVQAVRAALLNAPDLVDVNKLEYLDVQAVLAEAQRLLANDPNSLAFLTKDNVPTMFKVVPAPAATVEQLAQFSQTLRSLPGVLRVETPSQSPTARDSALWDGGVELIVYMAHGAPADDIEAVRAALLNAPDLVDATKLEFLDTQAALAEAQRVLANDPNSLAFLTKDNVPTMFKVVPPPAATLEQLVQFSQTLRSLPGVLSVETPNQSPAAPDSTAVTATSVQQETSGTTISGDAGSSATVHSEEGKYVIAARDYPSTIAKKFKVRFEDLLAINGWTLAGNQVPEFPVPGTTIRIPPGWTDPGKGSDSTTAGLGDAAPTTEPTITVGGG